MSYIIKKNEHTNGKENLLGGKAYNLSLLDEYNIPDWFCLTTSVFKDFLQQGDIVNEFYTLLSEVTHNNAAEYSLKLQDLILKGEFRSTITDEINSLLASDKYYAVRSSAVDEDGGVHSFAGILESYLYQNSYPTILDSIIKCYQSCFSKRAILYRLEKNISLNDLSIAVIIQEMVLSEKSGVIFTANPTNGKRNEFVISSTFGLGEGVVSGESSADEYLFDIETESLHKNINSKDYMFTKSGDKGTSKCPVPDNLKEKESLSLEEIKSLVDIATKISQNKKFPQDIEFAFSDNKLFILQTRNITSLIPPTTTDSQNIVFDNSNIQESFCGVTTPLTFSYANEAYFRVYHQMLSIMGLKESVIKKHEKRHWNMISFIKGRVFYNINSWYDGLLLFPSLESNKDSMEKMMGLEDPVDFIKDKKLSFSEKLEIFPTMFRCYWNLIKYFLRIDQIVHEFCDHFEKEYKKFNRNNFVFKDMGTLFNYTDNIINNITSKWQAPIINDFFVMTYHGKALRMLDKLGVVNPELNLSNLLSGEEGIQSTEPTKALLRIADAIRKESDLLIYFETKNTSEIHKEIQASYSQIKKLCSDYIEMYGDRVIGELKLESISLREDPSFMYSCLKSYLESGMSYSHYIKNEQALRISAEEEVFTFIQNKHGRFKLKSFQGILKKTRKGVKYRENMRLLRTRVFGLSRDIYLEMGRQFETYGVLENYRDIFFMTLDELERYRMGRSVQTDLAALVKIRKEEMKSNESALVSHHFLTAGPVYLGNSFKYPYKKNSPTDLSGLGCYPGIVSGEVIKMDSPDEVENVKGKILCTMRTDPGWAPVFPMIKGLIVERGSMLSHSAVIARELRIPTIVGVPDITLKLKSGDFIELDGAQGSITLLGNNESN